MRVIPPDFVVTDHAHLAGVLPAQHHPPVETVNVQINGTSIAPGNYQYSSALIYSGHKIARAILRGPTLVDIVGHTGAFVVGTDTADQAAGFSMVPSGITFYPTSYMGGYSRLHGDAYVSDVVFGIDIVLKDLRIVGSNLVLEFRNVGGGNRLLYCYGLVVVK
jgi:hypothetical protein